jgi:hypothetical protein
VLNVLNRVENQQDQKQHGEEGGDPKNDFMNVDLTFSL